MNDYTPNSHKYKEEQKALANEKKVEKIVTGKVKTVKKSGFRKIADGIKSKDFKGIASFVISDHIIPGIKDIVWKAGKNTLEMLIFGEVSKEKKANSWRADYVSYNKYSDRYDSRPASRPENKAPRHYEDLRFETAKEAEEVLDSMQGMIDQYDAVSILALYEMCGINGDYTDNRYGWENLASATVGRDRDGYYLNLPKAVPLPK